MKTFTAHLPALQVVVPLVGALLSALLRRGTAAWALALIVSWLMPLIAIALLVQVRSSGPISYHLGGWAPPWGIEYRVDLLSAYVLVLVSVIGAAIMPFARRSVAHEIDGDKQAWFYTMYLLCLTGLVGITITGDAFNVFVLVEVFVVFKLFVLELLFLFVILRFGGGFFLFLLLLTLGRFGEE